METLLWCHCCAKEDFFKQVGIVFQPTNSGVLSYALKISTPILKQRRSDMEYSRRGVFRWKGGDGCTRQVKKKKSEPQIGFRSLTTVFARHRAVRTNSELVFWSAWSTSCSVNHCLGFHHVFCIGINDRRIFILIILI